MPGIVDTRARYGLVPAAWLDHPDIGADELAVLAALATYADATGTCWPSQATLATRLKRSRDWVNRIIGRLDELGLLERRRDGRVSRGCLYVLPDRERLSRVDKRARTVSGVVDEDRSPVVDNDTKQSHLEQESSLSPGAAACAAGGGEEAYGSATAAPPVSVWSPTAADRAWALERFPRLDIAAFTERFRLGCRARGYHYADFSSAWRRWLLEPFGRLPIAASPIPEFLDDRFAKNRAACDTRHSGDRTPPRWNAAAAGRDTAEARVAAWGRALARRQAAHADADGRPG